MWCTNRLGMDVLVEGDSNGCGVSALSKTLPGDSSGPTRLFEGISLRCDATPAESLGFRDSDYEFVLCQTRMVELGGISFEIPVFVALTQVPEEVLNVAMVEPSKDVLLTINESIVSAKIGVAIVLALLTLGMGVLLVWKRERVKKALFREDEEESKLGIC